MICLAGRRKGRKMQTPVKKGDSVDKPAPMPKPVVHKIEPNKFVPKVSGRK
jgi:hypothetical protein